MRISRELGATRQPHRTRNRFQRPVVQQQQHERQRHQHRLAHQAQRKKQQHQTIIEGRASRVGAGAVGALDSATFDSRPSLDITDISPEGQHEEQSAEHVLAFRHPRHRFHPQRMNRKHRRHKRAAPQEPRHPPQHQEKQDRRRRVEQDVGEMMAAGLQSVKLAVQHVGNPGQRMPVGGMDVGERPDDPLKRQTPATSGFSYT